MNEHKVILTEQDDRKCRQVIDLFQSFLSRQADLCIVKADSFGYVILYDVSHETFQYNAICRNPEEIFREIMQVWELEYLFQTGMENGCDDFDSSELSLTPEQREYREKVHAYYNDKLNEILESE